MRHAVFPLIPAVMMLACAPASARTLQGVASWYDAREGKAMANGQGFHAQAMTAASRTLAFGTRIRVTNIDTGLSVTVTIKDRGPYIAGRSLDLTPAAMTAIGGLRAGVVPVAIEILPPPARDSMATRATAAARSAPRG